MIGMDLLRFAAVASIPAAFALGVRVTAAATVWLSSHRAGGRQLGRAFAGPVLAGAAMLALALTLPLPPIPAGALSLLAYTAVLVAVELGAHRDDVRIYRRALPTRLRARLALR